MNTLYVIMSLIIIICLIVIYRLYMEINFDNKIIKTNNNALIEIHIKLNEKEYEVERYEWLLNKNISGNEYIQNIVKNKDDEIFIVVIQELSNAVYIYLRSKEHPINICLNMLCAQITSKGIYLCDIYGGKTTRNGNGTLLLNALKEYIKKKGISKIYGSMVPNTNFIDYEGLKKFYKKNGFEIEENSNRIEYIIDKA